MQSKIYAIAARQKHHPAHSAKTSDFTLDEGAETHATRVLTEPGWSLYCQDQNQKSAVYVKTPPDA